LPSFHCLPLSSLQTCGRKNTPLSMRLPPGLAPPLGGSFFVGFFICAARLFDFPSYFIRFHFISGPLALLGIFFSGFRGGSFTPLSIFSCSRSCPRFLFLLTQEVRLFFSCIPFLGLQLPTVQVVFPYPLPQSFSVIISTHPFPRLVICSMWVPPPD